MNSTLFKAILAMDSYNRGYNAGINLGEKDALGNFLKIGNATIYDTRGDTAAQAIGFYAIAYKMGAETIIAYRGTDDFNGIGDLATSKDVFYGWTMGAGNSVAAQATMAFAFYQSVAGAGTYATNMRVAP